MNKIITTDGTVMALATYKPKAGQEETLMELVKKHVPILRELQLATKRDNFIATSKNGTVIEVFEWTSTNAINAAHQHPAVADIWEKMTLIADFTPLNTLPEANEPFPGFVMIN
jgi:hypothetical protein